MLSRGCARGAVPASQRQRPRLAAPGLDRVLGLIGDQASARRPGTQTAPGPSGALRSDGVEAGARDAEEAAAACQRLIAIGGLGQEAVEPVARAHPLGTRVDEENLRVRR